AKPGDVLRVDPVIVQADDVLCPDLTHRTVQSRQVIGSNPVILQPNHLIGRSASIHANQQSLADAMIMQLHHLLSGNFGKP
ncbi:hypothetical protein ACKI1O_48580, partial [Streptomyces scabiei]